MASIEHNLRWTCQFLSLLHRDGLPTLVECEKALNATTETAADRTTAIHAAAIRLVEGTKHLAAPA